VILGAWCRGGNVLANVYHSYRLQVRRDCLTVTGTVAYVRYEDDGDIHVDLNLPASEAYLLNAANRAYQYGQLVTEIVPADQPGCTPGQPPRAGYGSYDFGVCTGADIRTPAVGARITVTGPYVLDQDHGWMEIHPVWHIAVLSSPPVVHSAGAWCRATATPANDGYSGDYDVSVYSNQPYREATASDSGDTWSHETDGSGSATITLWHQYSGETINVTVGGARCDTTA
jgi:hypothetical protein